VSDVVDRVLAALNGGDVEAFVSCYSPTATVENGYDKVVARGHDELRARYGPAFESAPDLRVEAISRIDVGSFVVQEERVTGRGDPERHVAVYLIVDGLIARERLLG
jgi:putative hydrolase of HD superfamily